MSIVHAYECLIWCNYLEQMNFKDAIKWIGAVALVWLIEKVLDRTGIFDYLAEISNTKQSIFLRFFNNTITVWELLTGIILFLIFLWVFQKVIGETHKGSLSRRQRKERKQQLDKQNRFIEENKFRGLNAELGVKLGLYFDQYNDIAIRSIQPYCLKHTPPVMLNNDYYSYRCPMSNCDNSISNRSIDSEMDKIKAVVLSNLESEWLQY